MTTTQSVVQKMRGEFVGKKLYLVFLLPTDTVEGRDAFRESHFAFVRQLEQSGQLFMAGPYIDELSGKPTGSGLFIIRANSVDEVDALMRQDPYFTNGFRSYQIQPWRLNEGYLSVNLNFSDKSLTLD